MSDVSCCLNIRTDGDQRMAGCVRIDQVPGKKTDPGKVMNWFLKRDELYKSLLGISFTDLGILKNVPSNIDCVIRYDPGTDEFYSDSHFLAQLLRYLRGIDPEDIEVRDRELFPTRFGLSYAANLHALIENYRTLKGLGIIRKCLQAERLEIKSHENQLISLEKEDFYPVFEKLFKTCIESDFEHPLIGSEDTCRLAFIFSNTDKLELRYRKGCFYTDEFTCFH